MESTTTRRRPLSGGYSRGEETRGRIVAAAIRLFAERGFDRVSTREIAAASGVNPPALQYYFESKEGLFLACADQVMSLVSPAVDPWLRRAETLLADDAPVTALVEAYCAIIEPLIDLVFEADGALTARFLAVEEAHRQTSSPFVARFEGVLAALVGRLSGKGPDAPEARLVSLAINGQFIVFHAKREQLGQLSPAHARLVKATIVNQTRLLLSDMAKDQKAAARLD